jgi:hypothetical protein
MEKRSGNCVGGVIQVVTVAPKRDATWLETTLEAAQREALVSAQTRPKMRDACKEELHDMTISSNTWINLPCLRLPHT